MADAEQSLRDWSAARGADREVHFDGAALRLSATGEAIAIWDPRRETFQVVLAAASVLDPVRVTAVLEQSGLRDPVAAAALLDAHLASVRRPS